MEVSRRKFLSSAAIASATIAASAEGLGQSPAGNPSVQRSQTIQIATPRQPVIITRVVGKSTVDEAWKMLKEGADTLDAALHVCKGQEDDPNDQPSGSAACRMKKEL